MAPGGTANWIAAVLSVFSWLKMMPPRLANTVGEFE